MLSSACKRTKPTPRLRITSSSTVSMALPALIGIPPAPYIRCFLSMYVRPHATILMSQGFAPHSLGIYRRFGGCSTYRLHPILGCSRPAIRSVMAAYTQTMYFMTARADDSCATHKANAASNPFAPHSKRSSFTASYHSHTQAYT